MKHVCLAALVIGFLFAISTNAQVEGGAIAAIDEPSEGGGGGTVVWPLGSRKNTTKSANPPKSTSSKRAATAPKAVASRPKPRRWDGFVVGDEYTFMNFEVVSAEKPYHTRAAKAGGASGLVQVEILIETDGRVLQARARTGNKLLHPEAERAALGSRFPGYKFGGKPARAIGFLVYRFGSRESGKKRPCLQDSNGFKSPLRQWTALPFDSDEWLSGDRWLRARMRQDIFDKRIPNGKSRLEVSSWFGQPDAKQTIESREVWLYHINTGEMDDINMLAISFDAKGRAFVGMSQQGKVSMGGICGKIFPFDSDTF
jgi:hypothetical protein